MENQEQQLSKQEHRELKRQEKEAERSRQIRVIKMKKYLTRSFVIFAILVVGFGLWKLSQQSTTSPFNSTDLLQIKSADWTQGNSSSTVTLIEYLDFQCPACGSYHPIVKQLRKEYGDKVLFATRHFPLTQIHTNAMPAARAAEAAGRQNKFWEMHDVLFERQQEWSNLRNPENLFISYAESIGLDRERFLSNYKDKSLDEKIEADRKSALSLGVQGTPTFFLNGKKIENPRGYEAFKSLLESSLNQ